MHQFGGPRPRRRPREATEGEQGGSTIQTLIGLLPILFLFIFPLLSSFFSSTTQPATPRMMFDHPEPPYTMRRTTPNLKVHYFVNPGDVASYSKAGLTRLDRTAEANLVRGLRIECENEMMHKRRLYDAAQGWFYQDPDKLDVADRFEMPSCKRLDHFGISR